MISGLSALSTDSHFGVTSTMILPRDSTAYVFERYVGGKCLRDGHGEATAGQQGVDLFCPETGTTEEELLIKEAQKL